MPRNTWPAGIISAQIAVPASRNTQLRLPLANEVPRVPKHYNLMKKDFETVTATSRHCGDMAPLYKHLSQCITINNSGHKTCVVCGEKAYQVCMECIGPNGKNGVAMHQFPREGKKVACFYHHHNTYFYGLGQSDHSLLPKCKKDWTYPTHEAIKEHAQQVRKILDPEAMLRQECNRIRSATASQACSKRRAVDNGSSAAIVRNNNNRTTRTEDADGNEYDII
jgi:hypothetical protein